MKITNIIFAFLLANFGSFAQCVCSGTGCDWTILESENTWDATNINHYVQAGETVCIEGDANGERNQLEIINLDGNVGNEIIVRPCNGLVTISPSNSSVNYGIKFKNCKHFVFTGSGIPNEKFGIIIKHNKNREAISTKGRCKNFKIKDIGIINHNNIVKPYKVKYENTGI